MHEVSIRQFKLRMGGYIEAIRKKGWALELTYHGTPAAVVLPVPRYLKLAEAEMRLATQSRCNVCGASLDDELPRMPFPAPPGPILAPQEPETLNAPSPPLEGALNASESEIENDATEPEDEVEEIAWDPPLPSRHILFSGRRRKL